MNALRCRTRLPIKITSVHLYFTQQWIKGSRSEWPTAQQHFLPCFIALLLLSPPRHTTIIFRTERIKYKAVLLSSVQLYILRKSKLVMMCRRSLECRQQKALLQNSTSVTFQTSHIAVFSKPCSPPRDLSWYVVTYIWDDTLFMKTLCVIPWRMWTVSRSSCCTDL